MTFQVFFKCCRLFRRAERDGRFNLPGTVFGCMGVVSLVVRLQASLQIISQPSVSVGSVYLTQQDIYIGETLQFFPLACQGVVRNDAMKVKCLARLRFQLRRGSLLSQPRFERRLVGARGFEPPTPCSQSR